MLLEYFWMPIVQPYAISEPFSTAGKVNMNYRIAPFGYIHRATGLHAVLKSERILSIPTGSGGSYKTSNTQDWRHPVDIETTLLQWEDRFDTGNFFRTASEVCEQFLVPQNEGITASNGSAVRTQMLSHWQNHNLTGDNTMERPYANVYPRLCTQSNAYRVHYLVQTLQKGRGSAANTFDVTKDVVIGETRGDALIERQIDPLDPAFANQGATAAHDYAQNPDPEPLDVLYSYRVRHIRRFFK